MPYIPKHDRQRAAFKPASAGELTYAIYRLLVAYWKVGPQRFATIATIMGACVCAMLEFYRRKGEPYEDDKRVKHGDVG